MDHLQTSHTQPGQVPSQMSEADNWHKMARQNTKHGSFRALQDDRNWSHACTGTASLVGPSIPKAIFYSQLATGSRPCGHPFRRYKDALKKTYSALKKTYSCATLTQQPGKQLHKIDRCGEAPASWEYLILNINTSQTCNWREKRGSLVSWQLLCLTTVPSVDVDVLPPLDSTHTWELTSANCSSVNSTGDSNNITKCQIVSWSWWVESSTRYQ